MTDTTPDCIYNRLLTTALTGAMVAFLALPTVLAQATTKPTEEAEEPVAAADLPAASEIVARAIEAMGGEEAFRAMKGVSITGRLIIPAADITGTITVQMSPPNKSLTTIVIPGMGTTLEGFDGTTGWSMDEMNGPQIKEGKQLAQTARGADFYSQLTYGDYYTTMETVELTEFAGEAAYKVRLVDPLEDESFEFYSKESGLKLGETGTAETPMGPIQGTGTIKEYKEFDGIMVAVDILNDMGFMQQLLKIDSAEFEPIDDAVFTLPEDVQELLDDDDDDEDDDEDDSDEGEDHDEDEDEDDDDSDDDK